MSSIKLIIFDLDGVLVDSRPIHQKAFNRALSEMAGPEYVIQEKDLPKYEGLPTSEKLRMLTAEHNLPESRHESVWKSKQGITMKVCEEMITKDNRLLGIIQALKQRGLKIYCASNSIKETVAKILELLGIAKLFDGTISNQDVKRPKPHPEMYMRAVLDAGATPRETLVLEDSPVGRKAAIDAGCHLCPVLDPASLTLKLVEGYIVHAEALNASLASNVRWCGTPHMNLVLPIAGAGSRFRVAGYSDIKPLIPVRGMPMIQVVVRNLNVKARHVFIGQKEHDEQYRLRALLPLLTPTDSDCTLVTVNGLTEGAACTVLAARSVIDNDAPLLIANSDQVVEWDVSSFMHHCVRENVDGCILTFHCVDDPKWSYAKLDAQGRVVDVQEKKPISTHATVGIYFWARGADFCKYADQMIRKNIRVNNEFYVAPVYNEAIADGKTITVFDVEKMWGIGVPHDLEHFLKEYKGAI